MACNYPIKAYNLVNVKTENGKNTIVFKLEEAGNRAYEVIEVPCGRCMGCRLSRAREWAIRCVHEASLYSSNCFITLTYAEDYRDLAGDLINDDIDRSVTLVKEDFQKFMKRLRKRFKGVDHVDIEKGSTYRPIRFFHCGEYGSRLSRPHHHACLFNFDFDDKVVWENKEGRRTYISDSLLELWPFGYHTIADVTFESAAYVAKYCTKKINGKRSEDHYRKVDGDTGECFDIIPEYVTMSRRPGIGREWFNKFWDDVYPKDFLTIDGKEMRSPKYYDRIFDENDPEMFEKLRKIRKERSKERSEGYYRNIDKEKCLRERLKRSERRYEK